MTQPPDPDDISLCDNCFTMTRTVVSNCGKCGAVKSTSSGQVSSTDSSFPNSHGSNIADNVNTTRGQNGHLQSGDVNDTGQ